MKVSGLSPRELLDYYEMAGIAYNFYDNRAKADRDDEDLYRDAREKMLKCLDTREMIFNEIEKRVFDVC